MPLITATRFWERLREGAPILCDGAMGSELIRLGLAPDEILSANLSNPAAVRNLHEGYLASGAELITSNTFGLHVGPRWASLVQAGLNIALAAASAGTAHTGVWLSLPAPMMRENINALRAMSRTCQSWPELLLIETCTSLDQASGALRAAAGPGHSVLAITAHFGADGRMPDGTAPEAFAVEMERGGAHIVGANCGVEPEQFVEIAARMRAATRAPLLIQPSAGLPECESGHCTYPVDPRRFGNVVRELVQAGANIVGGCCGVGCAHIAAARDALTRCGQQDTPGRWAAQP